MSSYTVYYREGCGRNGRSGEDWERFENHTLERRSGMLVFRAKRGYGSAETVEIPQSAVVKVKHNG